VSQTESLDRNGPGKHLCRRHFLALPALGGLGTITLALDRISQPIGLRQTLSWLTRRSITQLTESPSVVVLDQCSSYGDDILGCLDELWRTAEMPDVRGKRVLVKPNLIDHIDGYPVTTAAEVVGAVLDLIAAHGVGEVVVGDDPGSRLDALPMIEASGLDRILALRKIPFVDLNYDEPAPVPDRHGWFPSVKELWLPSHMREADLIISVPKLKTHHWAGVSLSMNNLFGVIPGARYG